MNFKFTNEFKDSRIDEILNYVLGPRLWIPNTDYPDSEEWAHKAYLEIKNGTKRVMVAFNQKAVVGALIYQKHKQQVGALELKRLVVRPEERGRYIASFLVRNTEIEAKKDFESKYVLVDSKEKNLEIKHFFIKHGYRIYDRVDLYKLNAGMDLVYKKPLV